MDSNKKISATEELNNDKCAICHLEIQEPILQRACGHRFCRDCMMRYDFEKPNFIRRFKV